MYAFQRLRDLLWLCYQHSAPLPGMPTSSTLGHAFFSPALLCGMPSRSLHPPPSISPLGALAYNVLVAPTNRPARADLVAALGETTGHQALELMRIQMLATGEGQALLREKPRVTVRSPPEFPSYQGTDAALPYVLSPPPPPPPPPSPAALPTPLSIS